MAKSPDCQAGMHSTVSPRLCLVTMKGQVQWNLSLGFVLTKDAEKDGDDKV